MNTVLVVSPSSGSGKTTAIVALGTQLIRRGLKVGYRRLPGAEARADARFVGGSFHESVPADLAVVTPSELIGSTTANLDLLFVEADSAIPTVAEIQALHASVLVVAGYTSEGYSTIIREFSDNHHLGGAWIILNDVPEKGLRQVRGRIIPELTQAGLILAGVVPDDRTLLGLTVGELAQALDASVLCAHDQLNLPVEAIMLAAMSDEGAHEYFQRAARKVVVASGDRPDVHMPALATDTSCLVLTEGFDPDPTVFETAEQQGIPLLKVTPDTLATLDKISAALVASRFRQTHKIARAASLFNTNLGSRFVDSLAASRTEVA